MKTLLFTLERLAAGIEKATVLDRPSEVVAGAVGRALSRPALRDALSGTPIGHPVHPVLVAVPIGSWTAATYLDLTGGDRRAAKRLVGFGIVTAIPTALAGASDWVTTSGAERRVGAAHAVANSAALLLYASSWRARRSGRGARGVALSLAGAAALGAGGWLGGHLVYALGVGVDTTSFQHFPAGWTDVAAESEVLDGTAIMRPAGGVPVLLTRTDGAIAALADRCTHRGGPLHEGELAEGCVTCPWHSSVFRLDDGTVVSGPASRPQPVAEVRVVDGRVQVRRPSQLRALKTRPVGASAS
ncbi:MAG: Rieske 2Fe-2S domain-containing protein [Nocardioidaceae bacterium]